MNFKTALSSTSELIFIYKSGKTRKTEFIEVSYYGDDYLLAKTQEDNYYCLLDLDGDKIENDYKVVYRFFNGVHDHIGLLTPIVLAQLAEVLYAKTGGNLIAACGSDKAIHIIEVNRRELIEDQAAFLLSFLVDLLDKAGYV